MTDSEQSHDQEQQDSDSSRHSHGAFELSMSPPLPTDTDESVEQSESVSEPEPELDADTGTRQLKCRGRTATRATFEKFEFRIKTHGEIVVTNASYGAFAADHVYTVSLVEQTERVTCTCPAAEFSEPEYICKHAMAVLSRPELLAAACGEEMGEVEVVVEVEDESESESESEEVPGDE